MLNSQGYSPGECASMSDLYINEEGNPELSIVRTEDQKATVYSASAEFDDLFKHAKCI